MSRDVIPAKHFVIPAQAGIQVFLFSILLGGCAAVTAQKPKVVLPRILVTPFQCSNDKIGIDITKGFVGELGKKIEVLDPDKFTEYLSTHSLKMEKLPDGSISISKFVPPPPKSRRNPLVSGSRSAPAKEEEPSRKVPVKELEHLPGLSTAAFSNTVATSTFGNPVGYSTPSWMSQAQTSLSSSSAGPASYSAHPFNNTVAIDTTPSWAKPQTVSLVFKGTGTAISPVLARVINDLFKDDVFRTSFYQKTGVDYLVVGKAKEHLLTELEEGNLVTADTAQMKLLDLKTGEILLDESFKQGYFEIIAPDRIGSKFGSMVNGKIYLIRSERLKRAKEKLKQEQELRKQMGLDH